MPLFGRGKGVAVKERQKPFKKTVVLVHVGEPRFQQISGGKLFCDRVRGIHGLKKSELPKGWQDMKITLPSDDLEYRYVVAKTVTVVVPDSRLNALRDLTKSLGIHQSMTDDAAIGYNSYRISGEVARMTKFLAKFGHYVV